MIGVVGGGIAGLSAAYRLRQRGYEVQVFEAGDDLGGLAAVYETAGDPIEKFYHHLSKSEQTIVDLAHELGVGDRVEWRVGKNAYYVDGVVHPLDTPWQIAAYPHLSVYDKFRLAMLLFEVDVRGLLPRFDTYEDLSAFEDVPVREFLLEHTTRGVYENFWEPLLAAKFGDRLADVSAAWLLGRIKFRGERDLLRGEVLGYFEGGIHRLISALVDAVGRDQIATGARVTDLGVEDGAVSSLTVERSVAAVAADGGRGDGSDGGSAPTGDRTAGGGDGGGDDDAEDTEAVGDESGDRTAETYDVDAVVVATMPNVLEQLTGYQCDVDFQGTVCSVFCLEEPVTDTYWLNVKDDAPFGALIEHTNFVPPDRYGGDHLLYAASYVQDPADPLWQASDREVERRWTEGIADLFPDFDPDSVRWVRTARNPRTAPIYERGYLEEVVPYDLSSVAEGLYYAGMATRAQYPERSLNGGVVAGFECADRIAGVD